MTKSPLKEGDRVLAMLDRSTTTLWIFGWGTYIGLVDVPKDGPLPGIGDMYRKLDRKCAAVRLDDGRVVFNFESWVIPESKASKSFGKEFFLLTVDIDLYREDPTYARDHAKGDTFDEK